MLDAEADRTSSIPLAEVPPPPAYEETEGNVPGTKDDWEELDEVSSPHTLSRPNEKLEVELTRQVLQQLVTPSSRHSTDRSRYRIARRKHLKGKGSGSSFSTYCPLARKTVPRPASVDIARSITCHQTDPFGPTSDTDGGIARASPAEEDATSDSGSDEVSARLSSMSAQLSMLIEQGRRALEATSGLGVTPGWEDEDLRPDFSLPSTDEGCASISTAPKIPTERSFTAVPAFEGLTAKSRIPVIVRNGQQKSQTLESCIVKQRSRIPVRSKSVGSGLTAGASSDAR